jgi:hypothetical protein
VFRRVAGLLLTGCLLVGCGAPAAPSPPVPTVSVWDEQPPTPFPSGSASPTPRATPSPSATPSSQPANPCPDPLRKGVFTVGRMRVRAAAGYTVYRGGPSMMRPVCAVSREIVDGWFADIYLGMLAYGRPDGLRANTEQAARTVAQEFYGDLPSTLTWGTSEKLTVSGRPAWRVHVEAAVSGKPYAGDVVDVILVDLGDGTHGVAVAVATLRRPDVQREVDAMRRSLSVVG